MTVHRYRAHGLRVRSTVVLPLPGDPLTRAGRGCSAPDLVLRTGPRRPVPCTDPPGTLLAALDRPGGGRYYCFTRTADAVVLRYPGLCDFVGDAALRRVSVHLDPAADAGLVPVLAAGALLAVHLTLRHALVLHASAVDVDGRALAFVGASGTGKSTLAAALGRAGHPLVSDDVLRVEPGDVPRVHAGSTETRLRPAARALADDAPPGAVRATADGRLALALPVRTAGPLPLAACVLPAPNRTASEVAVRPLSPAGALVRLVQFPRVVGWREPETAAAQFQALADLVQVVPVVQASIPWGPPFPPGVLAELVEAVTGPALSCRSRARRA